MNRRGFGASAHEKNHSLAFFSIIFSNVYSERAQRISPVLFRSTSELGAKQTACVRAGGRSIAAVT